MAVCITVAVQVLCISWLSLLCAGQPMSECMYTLFIIELFALLYFLPYLSASLHIHSEKNVHIFNTFLSCIFKTGCLKNREISKDTALLSATYNITAFRDSIPLYPVKNITKAFWCDNIGIGNYVNMIFSQPVIIEGILSSGATSNNSQVQHYVSSFYYIALQNC